MTRPTPPTPPPAEPWPTAGVDPAVDPAFVQEETLEGAPAPVPPGPPPADRRIGAGMLLGLAAIALVAAGIAIAWWLTHRHHHHQAPTTVTISTAPAPAVNSIVPRLVGMKDTQALVRLGQLGLRPKEVFRPTKKPTGLVVSQNPAAGTGLAKGKQVTLVVDSGAPKVAVPSLTGTSFTAAQKKLDALGLDSTKTQVTSSQPAGTVVDQSPKPAARLAKGSTVTLSVSTGPPQTSTSTTTPTTTPTTSSTTASTPGATTPVTTAPTTTAAAPTPAPPKTVTVPDVTGQQESAAVHSLGNAGLVPSQDPLGMVEQQGKSSGTTVPYHTHVQINLSTGPGSKPSEAMPNVVGKTLPQALAAVNGANLRLLYLNFPVTSKSQAGTIVQQSPLAGGHAPQNAQVLVFMGVFRG